MSELLQDLADIVDDRAPGTTDPVVNLANGRTFLAEIEPIQDIEFNAELGRDARESVRMYVRDRFAALALAMNGIVSVKLLGVTQKFQIVRRKDNPASPQVEFGLAKLTEKDAQ